MATQAQIQKPTSKKELAQLSQSLKLSIDMGQAPEAFYFCQTTNEILTLYYGIKGELKTFKQWKEAGFKVKKGSKAYKFWSKPIKAKAKAAQGEEAKEEKEAFEFFGVCNLFSQDQVEKL